MSIETVIVFALGVNTDIRLGLIGQITPTETRSDYWTSRKKKIIAVFRSSDSVQAKQTTAMWSG